MAMANLFISFISSVALCRAAAWSPPPQTVHVLDRPDYLGWTPKPTQVPAIVGLEKRQSVPSPICGYVSGNPNDPVSCSPGYCGFQTSLKILQCCQSYSLVNGAYALSDCNNAKTACYASAQLVSCDSACQANPTVLKCSDTASPYCFEYYYTDIGYSAWKCATSPVVRYVSRGTSVASVSNTSPLVISSPITVTVVSTPSSAPPVTTTVVSTPSTPQTSSPSPSTPPSPPQSTSSPSGAAASSSSLGGGALLPTGSTTGTGVIQVYTTPSGSGSVQSAPSVPNGSNTDITGTAGGNNQPSTSTPTPTPSPNHTGAIAGGVVGGVVGLAILAGLAYFFLYHRRRGSSTGGAPSTTASGAPVAPTSPEVSQTQSAYTPSNSAYAPSQGGEGFTPSMPSYIESDPRNSYPQYYHPGSEPGHYGTAAELDGFGRPHNEMPG